MTTKRAFILSAVLATAGAAAPLGAQVPLTARALGMGGAYDAVARGHEAVFISPASLGLADSPLWSISFPQFAVGGTVSGPGLTDLADLAQFDDLDDARRDELLAAIPAGGAEAAIDVRAPLFGLTVGPVGVGVSYGAVGSHSVGRDIVELFLEGYEDGRTDYSVGNTVGTRATFWDVAVAYGKRAGDLSVGVAGHYIRGGTLMRSRLFEPRIDVEAESIEVDYVAVHARGGSGYALDVGAAYQPVPSLTFTASVANALAEMKWSEDLTVRQFTLDRAAIDDADPQDLLDAYEASERDFDPNGVSFLAYETAEPLYDEAYFPAVGRLGAAWASSFGTHLAASYQKRLTEGRLGGAWERQASVGLQQRLWIVGVRAGYSTNLDGGTLVAAGINLGPLDLGVGHLASEPVDGVENSGFVATMGLGVRVR